MDYEKKYNELANKIKKAYLYAQTDSTKAVLEDILPELNESEDEKIRKVVIYYFKNYKKQEEECGISTFYGIPTDDILDWLEKQGTKEVDPRYENLEKLLVADNIYQMSMNETMVEEAKSKAINALSELEISKLLGIEKQGEQKETPCDKCKKAQPSHSCQDITALGRCALEKQCEQKPWSEEDEDAIGMAIIALEDMYDEDEPNTTYGGYNLPFNKAAERLKSLKDRVQPKQEWSEEDERMCQETIDWFERKCFPFALENENPARKSITWLKSLKEKINL